MRQMTDARFQKNRLDVFCCISTEKNLEIDTRADLIHAIFERVYTPCLMKTPIRIIVMIVFVAALTAHVAVIPQIEIGLDQKLSMPEDSYVLKYFKVKGKKSFIRVVKIYNHVL